jgi:metal-responsive CopG/Arc/MetJ family transcriptional regulator
MANVKTAISLQKSLFERVDHLARELQISRSRLFVLAVEDFIRRHENRQLLEEINAAYDDLPDKEEEILRHKMRQRHRQMVDEQW